MGGSTDAEWLALIEALRIARTLQRDFVLIGDAKAVIDVANGKVRCRGDAARHLAAFRAELEAAPVPRIRHTGRAQNLAGIALGRLHPR